MAEDVVFDKLKDVKAEQLIEIAELAESRQFLVALRNAIVSATGWTFKNNSDERQKLLNEINGLGKKYCAEVEKQLEEQESLLAHIIKEGYLEGRIAEVEKLKNAMLELEKIQVEKELASDPTTTENPPPTP